MPVAELSINAGQHSRDIPSAMESERIIAEKAPEAVAFLERHNALDLAEVLGLRNYVNRTDTPCQEA